MKNVKLTVYLFIIAILFANCKKDEEATPSPSPPPMVTVSGEIKKSGTNIPVEGAIVSINNVFDTSDSDGKYSLSDIPSGSQTITVEKETFGLFIKTIEIPTNNFTYDIELTSAIPQVIIGAVRNSLGIGIEQAEISFGEYSALTNSDGSFEILDVVEGFYTIEIIKGDFVDYEEEITIMEGTNELEFELSAQILPQVSDLTLQDGNYSVSLSWPDITEETLLGYHVYIRDWFYHEDDVEINVTGGFAGNVATFDFGNWYLHNDIPLTQNQVAIETQEYYTKQQFYVVPVNIDGEETSRNNDTPIQETLLYANTAEGGLLGSFSLTDDYGPVTLPQLNSTEELGLRMEFIYEEINFFDPQDWTVQISSNGSGWTTVGTCGLTTPGWNSGLVPSAAGYYTVFSLNAWAGETVYFRTLPDGFSGPELEISNKIIHFVF